MYVCVCVCVCVCVSLDRQNPHLVFKTLRNQYTWASYDTLEKNYHSLSILGVGGTMSRNLCNNYISRISSPLAFERCAINELKLYLEGARFSKWSLK